MGRDAQALHREEVEGIELVGHSGRPAPDLRPEARVQRTVDPLARLAGQCVTPEVIGTSQRQGGVRVHRRAGPSRPRGRLEPYTAPDLDRAATLLMRNTQKQDRKSV